ncbi:indole acetimide hydrolase [Saccharopolyspora erythraea]|uniref:amidase n=1 Tax=Saccharopolyspora erythraea TaxID=1836 RepID=UPI001BEDD12A|nr:amidase [Saccharopolyspora erythraea]QUH02361.1 indole acetimide hydrolase [Saccharopolyspora erythraea]
MWKMQATELAAAVRSGEISAGEVIESHLERIAEANPKYNAITALLADSARAAAAGIDRRRAAGEPLGPLAGVPFTVKENIDIAGVPTTHGVPRFRDSVAADDAPPVARLRAADAIPIGHANMPDMTIGGYTNSQLFGETLNPWGTIRDPSGTSGGDGAAVASGMAAVGLGNDSGGSVRGPALNGGITALNPSYGRFPMEHRIGGHEPALASQLLPKDGPIARSVHDLRTCFEVLAGTDPRDPRAVPAPLDGPPLPGPIRVAVVADPGGWGVHPRVRAAVDRAAGVLSDAGYEVEETDVPRLADALECYGKLVTSEFRSSWPRIRPLLTDGSARHMELSMRQVPQTGLEEYLRATADRHAILRDWARFLTGFPLVLGPVSTEPPGDAEVLDAEQNKRIGLAIRLCTATTFAGVPAVAVPTGVDDGVPMGVQIIGGHFREDLCLAAASAVEAALGTFTPVG